MNIFQYPNQNDVLKKNTIYDEMNMNIGKRCSYLIFNKRSEIIGERFGDIVGVSGEYYLVNTSGRKCYVSQGSICRIFEK